MSIGKHFLPLLCAASLLAACAGGTSSDPYGAVRSCARLEIPPDQDKAIAVCTTALAASNLPAEGRALALSQRALAEVVKGETEKALADLEGATQAAPNRSEPFAARGLLYARLGDYDRALESYNRAIAIKPDEPKYFLRRAQLFLDRGEMARSLADIAQVKTQRPDWPNAPVAASTVYLRSGDFDRALKEAEAGSRLDPSNGEAYVARGRAAMMKGDQEKAIQYFDRAILMPPVEGATFMRRGQAHFLDGDFEWAILDFNQAGRLEPQDAAPPIWRALAMLRAHRDPTSDLAKTEARGPEFWPSPLLAYYQGKIDAAGISAAAAKAVSPVAAKTWDCEAAFYVGAFDLLSGRNTVQAKQRLEHVREVCTPDRVERPAAAALLAMP